MTANARSARLAGLLAAGVGLAHFIEPRSFGPITRIAFPHHTRTYVYINGGLETAIGLLISRPKTREAGVVSLIAYGVYLAGNVARNIGRRTRGKKHATTIACDR